MDAVLALDQGTTSSRAIVFDAEMRVCASAQQEFAQAYPQPGWVEHDAMEIWRTQRDVARRALAQAKANHPQLQVKALGLTNQRETTVLWDRATGIPVAPAIVWQDRRTVAHCEALAHQRKMLRRVTGLELDAYFCATKLAWLLRHVPGARQRAEAGELAFGTVDSWLLWNLSGGVHATDTSNASRTLLFDVQRLCWDERLLRLFDIPAAVLPRVVPSSAVVAYTQPEVLGVSLPIAGMAGDQQAATFGQACFSPGMAKNTYGTGCFMLMNTGSQARASTHRLLTTVAWTGPGSADALAVEPKQSAWALEGSVFMAGATVQWLRDGLGLVNSASEIEALAASVPDAGDVVMVPAFAGLGAPDWDGRARGLLVGLTRGTTRAHLARAALQAIAWQVADVFAAVQADAATPLTELRVDGGASANNLLMQMQADALGVAVLRPEVTETTALGAALLAGLAVGVWASADDIAPQWRVAARFEPQSTPAQRAGQHARWRDAVSRSRRWAQS